MAERTPEELRAIDAMVAEKVMRWPRVDPGFHSGLPKQERIQMFVDGSHRIFTRTSNDWSPTRDIAAAWSVVEKMVGKAWDFDIGIAGAFIGCEFENSKGKRGRADLQSSAPLAICLAALSALGEKP